MKPDDYSVVPVFGHTITPVRIWFSSGATNPLPSEVADEVDDADPDLYATATSTGYAAIAMNAERGEMVLYCLQPEVGGLGILEVLVDRKSPLYHFANKQQADAALERFRRQRVLDYLGQG